MSEPVRIGLLGHGTVGSAFADLVSQRADAFAAATGRIPEITGVLRRSEGSFEEILAASDVIVELIGGIDPARDYALEALRHRSKITDKSGSVHHCTHPTVRLT